MELVRRFSQEAYQSALEDWAWLDPVSRLTPSFTNPFGDVFLESDEGAVWFLDSRNGTVERLWPDVAALQAELVESYAHDRFFMAVLAQSAHEVGLVPGPTDVLGFKTAPVLGGALALDNLEIADFEVTLSIAGQIHDQLRDVPPGTPITGVSFGGAASPGNAVKRKDSFWRRRK
jgi:hypothetical protein